MGAARRSSSNTMLVFVDLARHGEALAVLAYSALLLPPADADRLARMSDAGMRRQRAATQALLRLALAHVAGRDAARATFERSAQGKPILADSSVQFSLSHTEKAALIAIARDHPVGVDIEETRKVRVGDERHAAYTRAAIALGDGALLPGHSDDDRFVAAWTRVEAMAKATGLGLAGLIAAIDLRGAAASRLDPVRLDNAIGAGQNRLVSHDLDVGAGLFAALALPRSVAVPPLVTVDDACLEDWRRRVA